MQVQRSERTQQGTGRVQSFVIASVDMYLDRDNVYVQCIEWCLIYKTCNPLESHDQFMYVSLLLYVYE